jgi:hypothetical protein
MTKFTKNTHTHRNHVGGRFIRDPRTDALGHGRPMGHTINEPHRQAAMEAAETSKKRSVDPRPLTTPPRPLPGTHAKVNDTGVQAKVATRASTVPKASESKPLNGNKPLTMAHMVGTGKAHKLPDVQHTKPDPKVLPYVGPVHPNGAPRPIANVKPVELTETKASERGETRKQERSERKI